MLPSKGTRACTARTSRRKVFHRNSSNHRWGICAGYHQVLLEGLISRSLASSHSRAREPSYNAHDGVRGWGKPHFTSLHNDPFVVEMKVASAIVRRILTVTKSSEIVPLVHSILGFKGQEVNPIGMIRLPLLFGDEAKARKLEFEADDGGVGKLQGDQEQLERPSSLSMSSCAVASLPSSLRVAASPSKGVVSLSPMPSPSAAAGSLGVPKRIRCSFSTSKASFSFFSFSRRCLYLAAASSNFWHFVWRSPICARRRASKLSRSLIRFSRVEKEGIGLTTFSTRARAGRIPHTVSHTVSQRWKMARSKRNDTNLVPQQWPLAPRQLKMVPPSLKVPRPITWPIFPPRHTWRRDQSPKKFAARARVFTEGSPIACGATY
ncbi:hypothetical protein Cgig2_007515 [Carnegiea gigantea]|uniref:Uncharacterized protein n=1 Tax=Carnegiea gigantea TaxID=171969 RepID=A0A9Q1Q784_9CARY|nr:hypothetical protein Cgig2_007515 [Carnegiea gigantea]